MSANVKQAAVYLLDRQLKGSDSSHTLRICFRICGPEISVKVVTKLTKEELKYLISDNGWTEELHQASAKDK